MRIAGYRVVIVDKPRSIGPGVWWIWRIINRSGHLIAGGYRMYWTEASARRASKRVLLNLKWGTK